MMDLLEAVSRSRKGEQEATRFLFTSFYGEAYRAAFLITRNGQLAEEATQEAFIKAFDRLGSLKEAQKFPSWLRAIVSRCAIDVLRREKNHLACEDPAALAGQDDHESRDSFLQPEAAGERAELREVIRRALANLDSLQRQVIILRFYQDLEVKEIAAILDCPVGTVKSRLHRGLRALEKLLSSWRDKRIPV